MDFTETGGNGNGNGNGNRNGNGNGKLGKVIRGPLSQLGIVYQSSGCGLHMHFHAYTRALPYLNPMARWTLLKRVGTGTETETEMENWERLSEAH